MISGVQWEGRGPGVGGGGFRGVSITDGPLSKTSPCGTGVGPKSVPSPHKGGWTDKRQGREVCALAGVCEKDLGDFS